MQQGAISRAIAWLLGANWKTCLSGYASMAALAIHEKPVLISWIPEPSRGFVWNLSEYVFVGGFLLMATRSKDKDITGGSQQQTLEGNLVAPGKQNLVDATLEASPNKEQNAARADMPPPKTNA